MKRYHIILLAAFLVIGSVNADAAIGTPLGSCSAEQERVLQTLQELEPEARGAKLREEGATREEVTEALNSLVAEQQIGEDYAERFLDGFDNGYKN